MPLNLASKSMRDKRKLLVNTARFLFANLKNMIINRKS